MLDELRRYEMYIVFQPDLDDAGLESRIERVNTIVTGNNGEIIEVSRKGKRRLAYSIKRHNTGIDVIYQVNLPSRRLEIIERQLNLYEDVIRYLVVRDDHAKSRAVASKEEIAAEVAALRAQPSDDAAAPVADGDVVADATATTDAAPATDEVVAVAADTDSAEETDGAQ